MLNLENFEDKLFKVINDDSFHILSKKFSKAKFVLFIGNGGNLAICAHAATDVSKYLQNKNAISPDSAICLTANHTDKTNFFLKWFQQRSRFLDPDSLLTIVITSSGTNPMLKELVCYLQQEGHHYHQIIGKKNQSTENETYLDVKFYHTAELMSLALVYQLISQENDYQLDTI